MISLIASKVEEEKEIEEYKKVERSRQPKESNDIT